MAALTPKIFIDGKSVEFNSAKLNSRGFNTASQLDFTIDGSSVSYRKYWNKEVTVFLNEGDSIPEFRGRIVNSDIIDNLGLKFIAVDGFGFLTGHDKATVVLDDTVNLDGLSPGPMIQKLISLANLSDIIGTDYIGNTTPIIRMKEIRGSVVILDVIKDILQKTLNKTTSLVQENFISVFDDGSKTQLRFELMADLDNTNPVKVYSYDNIINFKVNSRKIPGTVVVKGKDVNAKYRHQSVSEAFGENILTVSNELLESKAECMDFAHKVLEVNLKNQYEFTLSTADGAYLKEGDVVQVISDDVDVSGNFRIIGKQIDFSSNKYSLTLTINKRPPILSQFLL
tara:strand:- start:112 stop:1134 length:1023 start_codon:yes stop_codon:yes gene_type:complete